MRRVLAVGAHPDDIELGCGGALAKHIARGDTITLLVMTNGESGPGDCAERKREASQAAEALGATIVFADLPDGRVSNHELEIVQSIERVIEIHNIDTVYTHWHVDTHQDHRAIAMASWGACRHVPTVLCYEAPSSRDFEPTVFVDITETFDKKVAALSHHISQVGASRMVSDTRISSQAQMHGFSARSELAEGFMPHRMVLTFT